MTSRLICSECTRTLDRIPDGHSMIGSLCKECRDEIMREIDPHPDRGQRRAPGPAIRFLGFAAFKRRRG